VVTMCSASEVSGKREFASGRNITNFKNEKISLFLNVRTYYRWLNYIRQPLNVMDLIYSD
jgi:hypothetical protein